MSPITPVLHRLTDRLAFAAAWLAMTASGATVWAGDQALGRRIYQEGALASKVPLRGKLEGDVEIRGRAAGCATCHRQSGFGSNEGSSIVPAITGPTLFTAMQPRRADLFRGLYLDPLPSPARMAVRTPRTRAAYTDQTLAAALREGRDPEGRALDPLMPRYDLSDEDMSHLSAYLRSLGAAPDPGVDDNSIHFATVVSEGVDRAERHAMLSVIYAFVGRMNLEVGREEGRPGFSQYYKDEFKGARRKWVLHVWELEGPRTTWAAQLEAHYRKQPVFAILSGLAAGSWEPVHDYCDRAEIPCLFPLTDLPKLSEQDRPASTVYLSKGLSCEAEALAIWIAQRKHENPREQIVQVYRETVEGRTLARSFQRAMRTGGDARLEDVILKDERPRREFWQRAVHDRRPSQLVLWLAPDDLNSYLANTVARNDRFPVYLSSSLLGRSQMSIPSSLCGRVWLTDLQTPHGREGPHIYRVRSWLRSQGISLDHERIKLNTYLALSVTEHALVRMVDHFSRDYLIESVEHEMESTQNPGVFPHLSLGPGQRYASKGCYIVAPARDPDLGLEAINGWIVP
jgi:cytochrome c553